jgi:hypothetical protein
MSRLLEIACRALRALRIHSCQVSNILYGIGAQMKALFLCRFTLQFIVVALHDLVEILGWTHSAQVKSIIGRHRLWMVTLVNSIFPGLAVAFAIYFWNRLRPRFVASYWMIYCSMTLASAIAMW